MRQALLIIILSMPFLGNAADESRPPWLQPDTVEAALAIGLSREQHLLFRDALTDLINNQIRATNRLLRGNNVVDLERKARTATNRQFTKMDKSMREFLTGEQYTKYEVYRSVLRAHLSDWVIDRGGSSDDLINNAGTAINSNNNHH